MSNEIILIVDDDEKNLMLLEVLLKQRGYVTVKAVNGKEAVDKAAEIKPDLILLDIMMPVMDGYEACAELKKNRDLGFTPIVIVTASEDKESKIKGLEAGADDFLTKPIQKVELLARVNNLLKIRHLYKDIQVRNELISGILHRYVDKSIIEQIISNPGKYSKLGGLKKEVAILFCDIRNFTETAEQIDPEELITILNSVFNELITIVFKYSGTFDKYIGDCLMAFWGAPTEVGFELERAISAAMEMQESFNTLKESWPDKLNNLGLGIGINYGNVVVGNMGANDKMDYTVIGREVNIAQRVESQAKGGEVLITESTIHRLKEEVRVIKRESMNLKGISSPIQLYQITGVDKSMTERFENSRGE